ncbi:hypothetical protein C347_00092 [Cryptococcus neoformans AD2-60a]|uniref:Meiotic nuclear division protein 1 n=1 Tax=Cryptococcus neoformans Tu259-1 TaxID=1230072 RepID=A0A854Q9N7_CRYNE|nr:hypothetical protein C362_06758 [Cryptococcus neoformans var. grubii Bt1]OWZ26603.1 hypothetical protein C353_06821 [Cryptococcus neoformans var. grubii AD1-83a]OWZ37401.1 hypothetical protein C347_00092 [Cryptococcus neoformans var. grubii AD2-60a]OWZ49902.1 hypothetical protein C368_06826 [Cryptococcus neoformans var. grubii 125.91]OWZ65827.1 hypothetical protein AYX15_02776 [Cryptococcus neoformans var. grubii]OWZ74763.1 hypothetical protein C365_06751 [Cryptococcus neoformans var. grubi
MSKRGLSMEEKKTKMLEIFHESAEFYSLKELEKIAPKSKGIVVQSVKEVLDDLVSDGFVIMDKIGTGNYFWALPSAAGATKNATLAKATKELEKINAGISETQAGLVEAEKGREATEERRTLLATLQQEEQISIELKAELAAFGAADPVRYQKKSEAVKVCKDAAVRWTDNTLMLLQYTVSLGVESAAIRGMLGITEEWEDFKL